MRPPISPESVKQLFTHARSYHHWTNQPVTQDTLEAIYELMKWGPTSVNSMPARLLFVRSEAEKEKLVPCVLGSNIEQIRTAPVTVIVAFDECFFAHSKRLFPAYDATALFANDSRLSEATAFRNSSLQGAYMMFAARALGLDVCPMSGFDNALVDQRFFQGTTWKSNFICTLGYGDESKLYPRGPRLSFEESCRIV
ncbi:malonic semialdehyde reductase [Archangium violaceum]|uniref:malonic semialdehyde reductase n=1 Tax=Archangium violaceum TaxID=83451 RepID=UPI002B2E6F4D|nr:malonic semialdehyde reductase [Archangium gephyra]